MLQAFWAYYKLFTWGKCNLPLYVLLVMLVLSACKKTQQLPYNLHLSALGDTATITLGGAPEHFKLGIANHGNSVLPFYITPNNINMFSTESIIKSLTDTSMTEAEVAFTLWRFVADHTWHSYPLSKNSQLLHNPAMLLNSFGAGICDDVSAALVNLAKVAKLNARVVSLGGHVVAEIYYNNAWHMFDADMDNVYYDAEKNVCSVQQLENHAAFFQNSYRDLHFIKLKMAIKTIGSAQENYVSTWYKHMLPEYTSSILLQPGGSLDFCSSKTFSPVQEKVHRETFPVYDNIGTTISNCTISSDTVFAIRSAYALQQISVQTVNAQPANVYFSENGSVWTYKGSFGNGCATVAFAPASADGAAFVFNGYVKLKFKSRSKGSMSLRFANRFVFSDRALFNNSEKSFRLIRTDGNPWKGTDFKLVLN